MSITYVAACELLPSTLCRKYMLAVLVDCSAIGVGGVPVRDHVLRWGLGVLADGEQEFLGVWHGADAGALVWPAIAEDLKVRGVESIRFVVGSDPAAIGAAMWVSFPGVTVLSSARHFPRDSEAHLLDSLKPRQRRTVCHSIEAANQLNQRLSRAVARRGRFPGAAAAASFAVDWITRAERDVGLFGADAIAGHSHRAARAMGRSARAASVA